jgi:hypothetical protein
LIRHHQTKAKVVGFDEEARRITQGWNATIQFGFLGGPTVQFKFDDGACRAYRQPAARADRSWHWWSGDSSWHNAVGSFYDHGVWMFDAVLAVQ